MNCPKCGRGTFTPLTRQTSDGRKYSERPAGAGTKIWAANSTGICYTCKRLQNSADPTREVQHRPQLCDNEIRRCVQWLARFEARRRARGVPEDGLDPSRLNRPGLFLMEVA